MPKSSSSPPRPAVEKERSDRHREISQRLLTMAREREKRARDDGDAFAERSAKFDVARLLLDCGELPEAESAARELVRTSPRPATYLLLERTLRAQGREAEADDAARAAYGTRRSEPPEPPYTGEGMEVILAVGRDPRRALPVLDRLIDQHRAVGTEGFAEPLEGFFATTASSTGWQLDRAEEIARRLVETRPSRESLARLIEVLETKGDVAESRALRRRAARLPEERRLNTRDAEGEEHAATEQRDVMPGVTREQRAEVRAAFEEPDPRVRLRRLVSLARRFAGAGPSELVTRVEGLILITALDHGLYLGTAERIMRRRIAEKESLHGVLELARILLLRGKYEEAAAARRRAAEIREASE